MDVFMSLKIPRSDVVICVELIVTEQLNSCAPAGMKKMRSNMNNVHLRMKLFNNSLHNVFGYGFLIL